MKKLLMVLIPIVIISLSVFLIISNTDKGLSGVITSIDNDKRIIAINDGVQDTKLEINNTTKLLDTRNQPTIFSEFNVGFEVEVMFKDLNGKMVVETVRITKAPNIIVLSPGDKSEVLKNFKVTGLARVFENVLQIEVIDIVSNQVLFKKTIMASPLDIGLFGPFEADIDISKYVGVKDIQVNAFQYSAKDGAVIDKTSINLKVN